MKNRKIAENRRKSGAKSPSRKAFRTTSGKHSRDGSSSDGVWLYGTHAVLAALANRRRRFLRLCATSEGVRRIPTTDRAESPPRGLGLPLEPEILAPSQLVRLLPPDAVHQGLALLTEPLPPVSLEDLMQGESAQGESCLIVALDQVSDPRNVGAVLRSAAVFGAKAVLTTERKAASESGALAKAASGGLEIVPRVAVGNLAQALASLKEQHGFWIYAFASSTGRLTHDKPPNHKPPNHKPPNDKQVQLTLEQAAAQAVRQATPDFPVRVVLVLGAEGKGVRPLVAKQADAWVRIPTAGDLSELNVSNAAAVALYAFQQPEPSETEAN